MNLMEDVSPIIWMTDSKRIIPIYEFNRTAYRNVLRYKSPNNFYRSLVVYATTIFLLQYMIKHLRINKVKEIMFIRRGSMI